MSKTEELSAHYLLSFLHLSLSQESFNIKAISEVIINHITDCDLDFHVP